jgi:hypothetical protein
MSHTPGPWQLTDYSAFEICSYDHKVIASIIQMESQTYDKDRNQQKANARLIAAAPELLAMLKRAVEASSHDYSWLGDAYAAIAKAEGVQS